MTRCSTLILELHRVGTALGSSVVPTQGALVLEFHAAPRKSDTSINNANAAQLASTSLSPFTIPRSVCQHLQH